MAEQMRGRVVSGEVEVKITTPSQYFGSNAIKSRD
jgi:hypothetical protein